MRHRIDGLSLVLGLVFAGVAVAGLNGWITPDLLRVEWVLPATLVLLGLVLLTVVLSLVGRGTNDPPIVGRDPVDPPEQG